jgi:hypothetical protein
MPRGTTSCEVCAGPLNHRARGTACARCLSAGAAFARSWADDLTGAGMTARQAGEVLGVEAATVHARHRERPALA